MKGTMDLQLIKRVLLRFIRVFVGGMIAYLAIVAPTMVVNGWDSYGEFLPGLLWAAITAGLVAIDKLLRDTKAAP